MGIEVERAISGIGVTRVLDRLAISRSPLPNAMMLDLTPSFHTPLHVLVRQPLGRLSADDLFRPSLVLLKWPSQLVLFKKERLGKKRH